MSKRRGFLKLSGTVSGLSIGGGFPGPWMRSVAAQVLTGKSSDRKILVVIQLSGGNDGLNTIVPHRDEYYRKARPKLGIPSSDVIPLNDSLGAHPSLRPLDHLWDAQRFAIIQGVGYEKPNRSHFESMDIWHTCSSNKNRSRAGWLGRMFAESHRSSGADAPGIHLGSEPLPLALVEKGIPVPSIGSIDQFRWKSDRSVSRGSMAPGSQSRGEPRDEASPAPDDLLGFVSSSTQAAIAASERIESALGQNHPDFAFPDTPLGQKLRAVARLILAGLQTSVYYVTLDGFDTHANQLTVHAGLLRQWSEALSAFHEAITQGGQSDHVLALTFSEFGRRVAENASQGTDHGAAAPVYLSGPNFPKLLSGEAPNLTNLDDGDVRYSVDFRSVYRTLMEEWFGVASGGILQGDFPKLALFS